MADPLAQYEPLFQAAGAEWDIDPTLLKAIARTESGGDPRAVSKAGAQGLMQIVPDTQTHLGVTDPLDAAQSIYGAAKYLSEARATEGDNPEAALRFYHGGPSWRQNYGPESAAYVPKVAASYQSYAKAAPAAPAVGSSAPAGGGHGGDTMTDDQFLKEMSKSAVKDAPGGSPALRSDEDFLKELRTNAASPTSLKPAEAPADPYAEYNQPLDLSQTPNPKIPTTAEGLRNAFAPPAGYRNPATILPFDYPVDASGKDDETRSPQFNPLAPFRGPATALVNLLNTPDEMSRAPVGTPMSPENTATLLGLMTGYPKGAPLTAAEARSALARSDARASPLSTEFRASPTAPGFDGPAAAGATIDVGGGRTITVPAANPLIAPSEVNRNLPQDLLDPNAAPSMTVRPGAAGADVTPAGVAAMAPDEAAAYRAMANRKWLNENQQPGVADNRVLVKGVDPTLAQIEQKVSTSRELKKLRNLNTDVSEEERAVADVHNAARVEDYNSPELAGHEVDYNNAMKVAKDRIGAGLADAWSKKTTANAQPIADQINKELAGSAGDLPPVRSAMNELLDVLQKRDGTGLKDDPQQLYGARRLINWMQSKAGQRATPSYGNEDLQGMLVRVKQVVDGAIEPAAPGFRKAISDYATERQRLGVMKALQDAEPGLYGTGGSAGKMMFSKVHLLMKKIVAANEPDAALSPWQGLTEGQLTRLKNLHDDLKRAASAEDLERAKGSDTAQNAADIAKDYGKSGASLGVQAGANWLLGAGLGSMVVGGVRNALEPILGHVASGRRTRRGIEMLHPPQSKYPTRNVLDPDASP